MSTPYWYHFSKKGEASNDHKLKRLKMKFESSDDESDIKDDRTTNNNIKESGNYGNGIVADPDV